MITATPTETFQAKAEYNLGYVWLISVLRRDPNHALAANRYREIES